ncbi:MAG: hypothetical protein H0X33_14850 [Taibaiella sp.]|nr:hypothetical protein [Taibaiella sp.]
MIGQTFIINIAERADRWAEVTAECERVGIENPIRIDAVTGDNRPLAFNQSQHKAIKAGIATGAAFTVLEDDCVFTNGLPIPQWLPAWDIIYWGCNIIGNDVTVWQMPVRVMPGLFRLYNSWQSHAISYSLQMAQWIDEHLDSTVISSSQHIYDDWLRTAVMPYFNVYVVAPMIAYQRPSRSDIWNNEADYTGCFKQGNEYLNSH